MLLQFITSGQPMNHVIRERRDKWANCKKISVVIDTEISSFLFFSVYCYSKLPQGLLIEK